MKTLSEIVGEGCLTDSVMAGLPALERGQLHEDLDQLLSRALSGQDDELLRGFRSAQASLHNKPGLCATAEDYLEELVDIAVSIQVLRDGFVTPR
jgi:hypothetical protein